MNELTDGHARRSEESTPPVGSNVTLRPNVSGRGRPEKKKIVFAFWSQETATGLSTCVCQYTRYAGPVELP